MTPAASLENSSAFSAAPTLPTTDRDYPPDATLTQLLRAQARRTPGAVAVVFGENSLTYAELDMRAGRMAEQLREAGVGLGDLVGVFAERSFELVVGLVGVLQAGAAYVPFDSDYPAARLAYLLEDSQVAVLLIQPTLEAKLPPTAARLIPIDARASGVPSSPKPLRETLPADPAYVIYTSGTTGQPKGVVVSHGAICNQLFWLQETYRLTAADRFLQKAPFSFDISVFEIFWPLIGGGQVVLARPGGQSDPEYLVELIQRTGITLLDFLPSMLEAFLREPGVEKCSTLRQVLIGGELISQKLVDRFAQLFAIPLDNVYGPTETTIQVTRWVCQPQAALPRIPLGRPVANTRIHVLDEALQPVARDVVGEIFIGGRQLASGYWRRPELTAERFLEVPHLPEKLYRSGDLGYFDRDGLLFFVGRADDQVKLRGHRIELREVAAVVERHAAVREAVAALREDHLGNHRLVVYWIAEEGGETLANGDLLAHAAAHLPAYSLPAAWVTVAQWPLLPSGKIDRAGLPVPRFGNATSVADAPAMTALEIELAQIWVGLLGVPQVGLDDDFFELGGDSLLGLQLVTQIRERFGNRASLPALFASSTVRAMADCLREPPPSNAVQGAYLILHHDLAVLWQRFLPVEQIAVQDGFFDLGGTNETAMAMLREVEQLFEASLGLEAFTRQPTIEFLVAMILHRQSPLAPRAVLPLIETGKGAPFFYLHGDLTGVGFYCRKLARLLDADRPFHTLSPLDFRQVPWEASVEQMAERHVADILAVHEEGPMVIGGFCSAAIVAFEVAHILRRRGFAIERLILLEAEWAHPLMRLWRKWNGRASLPPEKRLAAFSEGWGTMEKWRAFREMNRADQHAWIRRKLLRQPAPPMPVHSAADQAWLDEYGQGPVIAAWAECAYRPRKIDVPVELILSDDTLCRRGALLAAWRGKAPVVSSHFLPGTHHGMITSGAETLAATLREILATCK